MGTRTDRIKIVAAFAAIYLIWGSTYLAIRIGLETVPPFLLAGTRFVAAGWILYLWLRASGAARPTDSQWWSAAITGTLMLVCGVGGVTWAEQTVPSGPAAVLAATVPLWMTIIDAAVLRRSRVGLKIGAGLIVGFAGVAVLIGPSRNDLSAIDPVGGVVIVLGTLCWSAGSLYSRRCNLPSSPAMTVAVQMITGGVVLLVLSSVLHEWQDGFALADVSVRSGMALAYLAVIGSIIALCAYVWLLRQIAAPAVATYAFVNPVVAVFLGWSVLDEGVGPRVILASTLIVGAVVLIQSTQWRRVSVERDVADSGIPATVEPDIHPVPQPAIAFAARSIVADDASRFSDQTSADLAQRASSANADSGIHTQHVTDSYS